ncbi:hypothetical protein AKJ45_03120 [candidate division MSBL1 archaeon SCGC-AAA261F19]|uniref:DUF4145 domain-containing protein n=7 Tax=candidate division MSBL1 TaxID=215777 RepID=A0A133V0U5_9EURY|nr:hypothetical protein AKJ42_01735 [candidate division MSBL1 archaeon SCGC-AAA261C02]KXB01078.1 hypothetical protein AKJ44_02970 [candidate division MSBL1 archaeon SCGC-AAA261F17]KXB02007.1 hypothetical protein AKJ43_02675 [candidate division MSBL1 archaeon SCGC-AAA261D19]KXB02922.1 hypothetical protein AKJ45_03120 [candidate division MSBL1 archaeon SCGC-AAA261F19]KXB03546.1 hypothetical protein AKJ47_02045 [candidate division MSBL1 archaeon SCGC-AAA261G05]KXB04714.1 hypothetical protein AKJ4
MEEEYKEFLSDLKEVKTALKYLGMSYYKRRIPKRLRKLRGSWKTLKDKSKSQRSKKLSEVIETLDQYLKVVFDEEKSSGERIRTIEKIRDERFDIDIKSETRKAEEKRAEIKRLRGILGGDFETELNDLEIVYGESALCTAFLLRRMLEKALYFSFVRNGKLDRIESGQSGKKFIGLKKMIGKAQSEVAKDGSPFLNNKTAGNLMRIKFLGDYAAHNFLSEVKMDDIDRNFTYLCKALEELSRCFKQLTLPT